MKATGIVRRIDDLGRVVIPKEIRRTLRIREGDPLEIFTDREGEIILKKYSPIGELGHFAKQYAETISQTTGHIVCITDRDQVIAVSGGKKELLSRPISKELEATMENRKSVVATANDRNRCSIVDQEELHENEVIQPIISEGDAIGTVILLSKNEKQSFGEVEEKLAMVAAGVLGKQMEQ